MVFVLDRKKRPLMPCSEKRARQLLSRGRAVVHRMIPFTIRLKDRMLEESEIQPVTLKLDPGSKTTGIAIVREEATPAGRIHDPLHLAELQHRGYEIRERLRKRAGYRRRRRSANLRYRAPRFDNRRRREGWLPPSLQSRVENILVWTRRYRAWAPIVRIEMELVRFDPQALQNPEIEGVEYQRGELFGYEVWEYLLEKWGRKCAYCGTENVPLEREHIIPKSRGGSNRVSNLTVACRSCNQAKGNMTAAEFGHPDVQARAALPLKDAAAVNATRWALYRTLRSTGSEVRPWSGGRTKWNRTRFGISKSHAGDALCVGDIAGVKRLAMRVLRVRARGRGQRCRTAVNASGFPVSYRKREKIMRRFGNLQTGDMVRAIIPRGKHAGTYTCRVAGARASGSFKLSIGASTSWKHCRLLHRADGYEYEGQHYVFTTAT